MAKTDKILYRPHKTPWFGTMVRNFILNRPQPRKYSHFLDDRTFYLIKVFPLGLSSVYPQLREVIEFLVWCAINSLSPLRVRVSVSSEDTLLIFGHRVLATEKVELEALKKIDSEVKYLQRLSCIKIVHLTHYFYGLSDFIKNLHQIQANVIIGEGNPSAVNPRIEKDLRPFKFQLVPFQPGGRFKPKRPFKERLSRAVSTGTIPPRIDDVDFCRMFKTDCLQLSRLELYEFIAENPSSFCDIFIENYFETGIPIQRKYFSQDIVSLYNNYKYYICTSEVVGFPQIAMYEAVACGCVLVSKEEEMLLQFGLVANQHYILISSYEQISETLANRDYVIDVEMNARCKRVFDGQSSVLLEEQFN